MLFRMPVVSIAGTALFSQPRHSPCNYGGKSNEEKQYSVFEHEYLLL